MGMVAIKTPEQVTKETDDEASKALELSRTDHSKRVVDHLASHVRKCWEVAKYERSKVDARLIDCLRRRKGEYSQQKLTAIKQMGGSEVYMMITAAKCRTAKSWLSDLFSPAGDRPFTLEPTPIPDLPPNLKQELVANAVAMAQENNIPMEVVQEMLNKHKDRIMGELKKVAEERADNMATAIEDMLVEGGWRSQFDEFLDDLVTYPAAIMKGFEFRRAKTLKWVDNDGNWTPQVGTKIIPRVRRVSPFRAYPSPSAGSDIANHWFIEHQTLTRQDLSDMRSAEGYNAEGIAMVLAQYGEGGLKEWMWSETERAALEGRSTLHKTADIDAIEYSGSLRGQTLLDWGMSESEIDDPFEEYSVSVMVVGTHVIRAVVNPDPSGKSDFFKACWENVPSSFWGTALPESLADTADTCNAAARALINNMGMASGPMVWVEMDRLAEGQNIHEMYPWKPWQSSSNPNGGSGAGIGFFQPQSNASELMAIYERFSRYGDDICGLPAYAQGSDSTAGAANTASGLSMLLNAASKSIKHLVRMVDIYVIEPVVGKAYNHLMLTSDDINIKGDLIPKARGSESLVHKEQAQIRQAQLLAQTNNPTDMEIIGQEGRLAMLAEVMKSGSLPVDRILPTAEELREKNKAKAEQMMQAEQQQMNQVQPAPSAQQQGAASV